MPMKKMLKRAAVAKKVIKKAALTKTRSPKGREEAKKATRMTVAEWSEHQVGMEAKWPLPEYMGGVKGVNSYRDETYAIITHWRADTRISYRPHAKRPGSKSHVRYEEYSCARTVGEALASGTWPKDWCWDYERGFIKVHGPVRDEPIDISKQDEKTLTDVDLAIHKWYARELANNLGLDVKSLGVNRGSDESLIMRAHRLVSQRDAKAILEKADRTGVCITDADVEDILGKWHFVKNIYRSNVMEEGQTWVYSDTLGLNRDRIGDIHLTSPTKRYPQVTELISRWLRERLPQEMKGFSWTSLNVNYDYAARIHRDNGNFGPSMIKAFGPFEGGSLNYWPEDDKSRKLEQLPAAGKVSMQIRDGLAMFNGNCAHSVDAFEGHRYSVVFFTLGCFADAPEDAKQKLRDMGIAFPTAEADPYDLLRPPSGQLSGKTADLAAKSGSMPAYRYWKVSALRPRSTPGSKKERVAPVDEAGRVLRGGKFLKGGGFKGQLIKKATLKKPAGAKK